MDPRFSTTEGTEFTEMGRDELFPFSVSSVSSVVEPLLRLRLCCSAALGNPRFSNFSITAQP
jgi:hypothetical protein